MDQPTLGMRDVDALDPAPLRSKKSVATAGQQSRIAAGHMNADFYACRTSLLEQRNKSGIDPFTTRWPSRAERTFTPSLPTAPSISPTLWACASQWAVPRAGKRTASGNGTTGLTCLQHGQHETTQKRQKVGLTCPGTASPPGSIQACR